MFHWYRSKIILLSLSFTLSSAFIIRTGAPEIYSDNIEQSMTMNTRKTSTASSCAATASRTYDGLHNEEKKSDDDTFPPSITLRLHLVRHSETEGNRAGLVLGQIDSPLTDLGVEQARAAHKVFGFSGRERYWKRYSSDLGRCVRTSRLILGLERKDEHEYNNDNTPGTDAGADADSILILDKRLRERAKGVREGLDKRLNYEEAMEIFKKRLQKEGKGDSVSEHDFPLLENTDEVMDRFQDWIEDVIQDAISHHSNERGNSPVGNGHGEEGVYDVLAISHSGTVRIVIEGLVGEQLSHNVEREEPDRDGEVGRLVVPNTSKTIIEFTVSSDSDGNDTVITTSAGGECGRISWAARLVELTNVSHFELLQEVEYSGV